MNRHIASGLRWAGTHRAWVALIALVIFASIAFEPFLTQTNLLNVVRQASIVGLLAAGMTFVIITRGIDLSVGSILALSGITFAACAPAGLAVAVLAALGVGLAAGLINAFLIVRLNIDPFVATIASMFGFRGAALLLTGEEPVRIDAGLVDAFFVGRSSVLGIPIPVLVLVLVFAGLSWASRYTRIGRVVYALGGNAAGSQMMGLPVARAKTLVYALSGVLAGMAGIILASRLGSGQPTAGDMYDLSAIAAVVIGGTLLSGGAGRLSGTLAGVLLIATIANVFNLQGQLSTWWQNALNGAILLALIVIQAAISQRRTGHRPRGIPMIPTRSAATPAEQPSDPETRKENSEQHR
ncbi:ABC transporter permease [Agromyces aerolatus]|uniref:ABC transporter permease n=1 Tax=Agromyces sp. LY-1074 TaxID=3074080 RepID=UPI0028621AE3|nr:MULTISPECIES: ABC transporter permease [unclassified Agromyces]MDR5699476.1 ABC transporter permease [Agromyces sp. LY-1074]MDR5705772.1 ABC transporter permease [Agromyces sp. LY-1358]